MILATPTPVACQGSRLAAIYVPAFCPTPGNLTVHRLQLVVTRGAPQMVTVVPPGSHHGDGDPSEQDVVVLALDPAMVADCPRLAMAQEVCDPYVAGIAHALGCGFRAGALPTAAYLESLSRTIAEHLQGFYSGNGRRRREERGLSPGRLQRALAIIEERLGEQVSVDDIAEAAHLSAFHFTRMFRRSTGMSPHAYITQQRMEVARQLLATTSMPIAEIARRVGYRTQAHFTHVFREENGITPRAYRVRKPAARNAGH